MIVGLTIVVTSLLTGRSGVGHSDVYFSDRSCLDRSGVGPTTIGGLCSWSTANIDRASFFKGLTAISDPYYSMRVRVPGRAAAQITFARGPARPLFSRVQHGERDVHVQIFNERITVVRDAEGSYETREMPRTATGNALHLAMIGGGLLLFGFLISVAPIWELFDDRRTMAD